MNIALVASAGGHFLELHALRACWQNHDRFWVTFPGPDTDQLLQGERVYHAYHPTNRHIPNLYRNFRLAGRLLTKERPTLIITTGAGIAVPFIYRAKLAGIPTIFIESLTFSEVLSLSGWLVYRVADDFLVQWPGLAKQHKRARYYGQVL